MIKLLVVDDEPPFLRLIKTSFSYYGCDVLEAPNGLIAMQIAEKERPDIILLDVMMPGMDGIEVCKRLRDNPDTSSIPVVLITAHDPLAGRAQALMAGATDYVTKPIVLDDLWERVRHLLGHGGAVRHQAERLLQETAHSALVLLSADLVWLLALDPRQRALVSRGVASRREYSAIAGQLHSGTTGTPNALPLDARDDQLVRITLNGTARFNLSPDEVRGHLNPGTLNIFERLGLSYLSFISLQSLGIPLGALVIGSREPQDVDTTTGRQRMVAVTNQAAVIVQNERLIQQLAAREVENREEREFYQRLLDTMGHGVLTYNEKGEIQFVNRRLALMIGGDFERLPGARIETLFHPDDRDTLRSMLRPPSTDTPITSELRLIDIDRKVLPVLAVRAGRPVSLPDGKHEVQYLLALTDLSEQKERERMLTEQSQRLRALHRAAQAVSTMQSLDDALMAILAETQNVLGAMETALFLFDPVEDCLVTRSCVGRGSDRLHDLRVPIESTMPGAVLRRMQSLVINQPYTGASLFGPAEKVATLRVSSIAAAPLVVQGKGIGVLTAIEKQSGMFTASDRETLEGLARTAAIALENARLFGEIQSRVNDLTLLLEASEAAASPLEIEHVVEKVAAQLITALAVDWCMIGAWHKDVDSLITLAEVMNVTWPEDQRVRLATAEAPLIWQVVGDSQPQMVEVADISRGAAGDDYHRKLGLRTVVLQPIEIDGHLVGIAEMYYMNRISGLSRRDLENCQFSLLSALNLLEIDTSWDTPENLKSICERLLQTGGVHWCRLFALSEDGQELTAIAEHGRAIWPLDKGPKHSLDASGLRHIALIERNPLTAEVQEASLSPGDREALAHFSQGSLLILPLLVRGEAIGLIQILDVNPARRFTDAELSLARAFANVMGTALGNARLYAALLRRAAQLEAAYNDLREADRLKEEWIQNVSHELRTPLATMIGYIELLLARDLGPLTEEQRQAVLVMEEQSERLARHVEDILALQDMADTQLNRTRMSLAEVAREAIEQARPNANLMDITLRLSVADYLPDVYADPDRIRLVIDSLLSNAIKFSPAGSEVVVTINDLGSAQHVEVLDHGIGIPIEEQPKIWRRFYQVDGSMTRSYGGAGLGLAIVKQVILQHEGRVWVDSEPGKGSRFHFVIPKGADFQPEL